MILAALALLLHLPVGSAGVCDAPGPCPLEPGGVLVWECTGMATYTVLCTPLGGCLPDSYQFTVCDPVDPLNCRVVLPTERPPLRFWSYATAIEAYCCNDGGCGDAALIVIDPWPDFCEATTGDGFAACCAARGGCA